FGIRPCSVRPSAPTESVRRKRAVCTSLVAPTTRSWTCSMRRRRLCSEAAMLAAIIAAMITNIAAPMTAKVSESIGNSSMKSPHRFEQRAVEIEIGGLWQERRSQPGALEGADQPAVGAFALEFVDEEILRGDHIALHADHLGDMRDPTKAV